MAHLASKVSIISQAFFLLGRDPISTLDTTNKLHTGASQRYDVVVPNMLTQTHWKHAGKTVVLDRLNEDPPTDDWGYTFQLPNKAEMLLAYRVNPSNFTYEIMGDKLYSNASTVTLFYIFEPTPDQFPIYFTDLLVYTMAAQLAMPVTQSIELAELWDKKSKEQAMAAMAADWQQAPNRSVVYDGLTGVHY